MGMDVFVAEQKDSENLLLHVLLYDSLLTEVLHHPVHQVGEILDGDIQQHGASLYVESEVDHGVEGEGGDVRFPPLSLLSLEVLLILDPPGRMEWLQLDG